MPETGLGGPGSADSVVHLFVYYRVDEADLAAALPAVHAFHEELRAEHPALQFTLMRRPGASDGQVTLMESCQCPGALPAGLRARLLHGPAALRPWLHGERHLEEFVPCA